MLMKISTLKKSFAALAIAASPLAATSVAAQTTTTTLHIYDEVTFYDQYLVTNLPDEAKDLDDGILRHTTSMYAVRLTDEQLAQIGTTINIKARVYACCDNYDRVGNMNIALVPKGSASYNYDDVQRIEIGRFITPFMNMNRSPKSVSYRYSMDYLSYILRDRRLRDKYDLWLEYEIYGVPYAAQEQISGCSGRVDTFQGSLDITTSTPAAGEVTDNVLVPIAMKHPEYRGNDLNNYTENATDTIGKTTKTYTFEVPEDVQDAQLVIVTSNHGAGGYLDSDGVPHYGEEYCRRMHFIYYDGDLALTYRPGRTSCERWRIYNTQSNGIYGATSKTDEEWQSFSNWCPGDVIDNRIIHLGAVKAGTHKVRITVPDAEFNGNAEGQHDGNFPVSIFFQGLTDGNLSTAISQASIQTVPGKVKFECRNGQLSFSSDVAISSVELYSGDGRLLRRSYGNSPVSLSAYGKGLYVASVELADGMVVTRKITF